MFTGIVQGTGQVEQVISKGKQARIILKAGALACQVKKGDSVSVSGVCLTAVEISEERIAFDAIRTTLSKSTLSRMQPGQMVNIELALRFGDPVGGHLVYGHVDGVGTVQKIEKRTGETRFYIKAPEEVLTYMVERGSVAVDGISLTVAKAQAAGFEIAVIPHTLSMTTLGQAKEGDLVNLEGDMIGRWVEKFLHQKKGEGGITWEKLSEEGYH